MQDMKHTRGCSRLPPFRLISLTLQFCGQRRLLEQLPARGALHPLSVEMVPDVLEERAHFGAKAILRNAAEVVNR